jgi:RNA polymerase sigma factor (sigma-70 family)
MASTPVSKVVQHLRRTALQRAGAELSDGQLLKNFVEQRDETAFAALVHRHSAMVWGVCRRLLFNHHDAEDVFQATFLVLVRKSASIAPRELLAGWLHGVAYRTALRARAATARRRARERQVEEMPEPDARPQGSRDLGPLLDQELNRLPGKYRAPLLLCHLEGKTRQEAARLLGWPEGTVAGRLVRARALLASRLSRHGPVLSVTALAALAPSAPASVVFSTVKAAGLVAAGQPAAGPLSAQVAALTEEVLRSMWLRKLKVVVAVFLALAGLAIGARGLIHRAPAGASLPSSGKADRPVQDGNLAETVLALEQRLWGAYAKQDQNTFKNLLPDDFVGIDMFGRPYTRAGTLDYVAKFRVIEHAMKGPRVVLLHASGAVVTYEVHYKVRPTAGGKVERTTRRATSVWAKRKGRWWNVYWEDRPVVKDAAAPIVDLVPVENLEMFRRR